MINSARSFFAGLALLVLAVMLASPGRAQSSPPASPSRDQPASDQPLGDALRFLSHPRKAEPRRPARRQTVAARRAPPFVLVPVLSPFGFTYVRVPVYPVVYAPPPVVRVPVVPLYAYRPVLAYRPVFVPAYPYGVPVH